MKKEKSMRSFKDYTPQSSPQDESEILKEAATAPDPAMESSAAELTKKIAAAFNGKSNSDMLRSILGEAEKSSGMESNCRYSRRWHLHQWINTMVQVSFSVVFPFFYKQGMVIL